MELKKYLIERLKDVPNIKIYNESVNSGVLLFNVGNYFSQDVAIYLNNYKICIRAGNHCAKMLQEVICTTNTCRVSLYFYNTKEEIDILVNALMDQDKILDTVV
jgi:cysteine desulfurase/selenocysteine lyase